MTAKDINVADKLTISIDVGADDATGKVTIEVDGETYTKQVSKGKATFEVTGLKAGSYKIKAKYAGDDKYAPSENTASFKVNKIATKLTAKAITATYNKNKNLVVTLKDVKGKPVSGVKISVKIKSTKKYTTDKNGQVKFSTDGLAPKTYSATSCNSPAVVT